MPHFPKPWFRPSRNIWYVQIGGRQHNLGADEKEAFRRYHELMAAPPTKTEPPHTPAESVAVLLDRFVDWVEQHQSPDTYRWYKDRLQSFLDFKTDQFRVKELAVAQLKPFHVQEWIDGMESRKKRAKPLKSGTKRNCVRAVKRAMKWAEEQGYIEHSPIAHLKKPAGGKRDNVISPEIHCDILAKTRDQNFRDLCHFCFLTGSRAAEALAIEARHVELSNHRIVFPIDEEKMERAPRIIYLNDEAELIIRTLALKHTTGKLFRNTRGHDWHPDATNCRLRYLAKKIGKKVCLTDYRHSLATRLLTAGVDALTVSIILGHADPSMLAKVYQHINHEHSYLLEALRKATSSGV